MSLKVDRVYKQAKKDKNFSEQYLVVPGNEFPFFPSHLSKSLIASMYVGWLIGKHGGHKASEIYDGI